MDERWRYLVLHKYAQFRKIIQLSQRQKMLLLALVLVFLIASFLRLYSIGVNPPILNPDEASIAYNAYLLLETGRDEWNQNWPVVLQAFGDQKIAGYTYLTVASFFMFGVSDFSVRLPAALAGILIVGAVGLLLRRLTFKKQVQDWHHTQTWLLTMALVSIQPVFIWYSRVAFEANVALFWVLCLLVVLFGTFSTLHSMVRATLAALLVLASVFLYNSPLLLVPFLLAPIPWWYGLSRWRNWLILLLIPGLMWLFLGLTMQGLTTQKSQITIFGDPHIVSQQLEYYSSFDTGVLQRILGNRYVYYTGIMASHFWESVQPHFILHNQNGHPWHALQGTGYLTYWVYWFGWLGIMASVWLVGNEIIVNKGCPNTYKSRFLLLYLLVVSLIPAVITVNAPHATRTLLFFVIWAYFAAIGILVLVDLLKIITAWLVRGGVLLGAQSLKTILYTGLLIGLAGLVAYPSGVYAHQLLYTPHNVEDWHSDLRVGLPTIIRELQKNNLTEELKEVAFVDERGFLYIIVAWYARIEPELFWQTIERKPPDTINFTYGSQVGKYSFIKRDEIDETEIPIIYWQDGWRLRR